MSGGGGSANAAAAQSQADAMRAGEGAGSFLTRGDWVRLTLATLPIIALVVFGIFFL